MNRTVSVVLATYNGERYLEEQLQSILAQSYANLEIIISDDNSGDSTISLVKSYACKDSRIKLLTNPKQIGIVPNFLNALKSATGNYICFSDQDDYWEREKVKTLVELIEQNNQNMLAYSDLGICDQGLGIRSPSFWRSSGIRPLQGCCDERILIRNLTPGCSMLFRGEVKKKLETSSIHPPFMHDHLAFALSSAIGRVVFTPQPLVRYRQHSGNSIGVDNSSAFDATAFAVGLMQRITFFKDNFGNAVNFDLEKIASFCRDYANAPKHLGNWSYHKYYQFMRPLGLKFGLTGAIECIFPKFYSALTAKKRHERGL